jgi:hypothetical protein
MTITICIIIIIVIISCSIIRSIGVWLIQDYLHYYYDSTLEHAGSAGPIYPCHFRSESPHASPPHFSSYRRDGKHFFFFFSESQYRRSRLTNTHSKPYMHMDIFSKWTRIWLPTKTNTSKSWYPPTQRRAGSPLAKLIDQLWFILLILFFFCEGSC